MSFFNFQKVEQQLGYKYAPHGLLASNMAVRANLPDSIYMDWMHSICSSGGVGQYEVNQFLVRLVRLAGRQILGQLDNFRQAIVWPKREPRHTGLKLEDRVVMKRTSHVRMFASECLQIIMVLGLYSVLQLQPMGMLLEEVECLLLLGRIVGILRSGHRAVARVMLLRQLVLQHHDMFLRLYPGCAKIKPHLLFHIVDCIEYFQANLSCFSTERKHKASKHIGSFAFKRWCLTMMRRDLQKLMEHAAKPDAFRDYHLEKAKQFALPRTFHEAASGIGLQLMHLQLQLEGKVLHTPVGAVHVNDLVAFAATDGSMAVGFALKLLQHADGSYWCLLLALESLGGAAYNKANGQNCLIPATAVRGTFPYFSSGERWYLVAPVDLFQ